MDIFSAAPPAEVFDQIRAAAAAYERLLEGGRQIRFGISPATGQFTAELQDLNGNTVQPLSASDVLRIAAGATVE